MSVILPRSQKTKTPPKLSHSSKEANKGKKSFQGTGHVQSTGRKQEVQTIQSHPWSGFVEKLLSPLPPDIRYNIPRALGGVAEAVGRIFPNQNSENQVRGANRSYSMDALLNEPYLVFKPWEDHINPPSSEEHIRRLFLYLESCKFLPIKAAPCMAQAYNMNDNGANLWNRLTKPNEDVNLTIRYSRITNFNKEKLKKELFEKPENALFDFWDIKNKLASLPFPWTQYYPNEPIAMEFGYRNHILFFQSDSTGIAPPFEWRDHESFRNHFNTVTKGLFHRMDFTNASIAGHSILSLLQLPTSGHNDDRDREILERPDYFHVEDLNIYIHGDLDSDTERMKIAKDILDGILQCCVEEEKWLSETEMAPRVEKLPEKYQIVIEGMPIINLYPNFKPDRIDLGSSSLGIDPFPPLSLAQLLHSFDIDSYCWAYDGSRVVATLRGIRAACSRMNVANPNYKCSLKYEERLVECWRRGYHIAIPGATTRQLHRNLPRFLPHKIDIPRLYNLYYPEDKDGGDGDPAYRPSPRDVSPGRPATGFIADLKFKFAPLWS